MSTSWMAPLGGLPGLGAAVLAGVVAALALICYRRAGAVPALPPRRDVLEFSAGRLAGATAAAEVRTILAALEALGQADPDARQAVLDVVCGYLRRPSRPPGDTAQLGTAGPAARAAAQALLHARLVPQHGRSQHGGLKHGGSELWSGLHLNLNGASVQDLDLRDAVLRSAGFAGTRFSGVTRLTGLRCAGRVVFTDAVFTGPVRVDDGDFTGPVRFTGARFDTTVSFTRTTFRGRADFAGACFTGPAEFGSARFLGDTAFSSRERGPAAFLARAGFEQTCFAAVTFAGVCWPADTSFQHAEFAQPPHRLSDPGTEHAAAVPAGGVSQSSRRPDW
jgi:hypothetical protein